MKAFLGGVAAMLAIAVVAAVTLGSLEDSASDRATSHSGSVRLGEGL
jgi:hypothetical protein